MAQLITVTSLADSRLSAYCSLTDTALRRTDVIIVESPKVISTALDCGLRPLSILTEAKHISGDAAEVIGRCPEEMPVYTGNRDLLRALTGFTLTRGVLCAMERPQEANTGAILRDARRVGVLWGVCDTTNVGAIFRSAAALGMDALLLSPDACDPYNRRCVRVSMGGVFRMPWARLPRDPLPSLHTAGFTTLALALRHDNVEITDSSLQQVEKMAILLGTEGDGLPEELIEGSDLVACIPMSRGVDSLNVGAAAAIAFFQLSRCVRD